MIDRRWQLEARVPVGFFGGRLGIELLAQDGTAIWSSYRQSPGWITGPSAAAQSALAALAPPGLRVYVTDRDGFVLARHGASGRDPHERNATGLLPALLRPALGGGVHADPPPESRPGQLSGRHLELAALGNADARWYASPAGGGLVAAAAPVPGRDGPAALVVAERDTAAILSLTRGPTRRLVLTSLLLSLGAAAVLFGHAVWLSWRIRRLRDAAEAAVGDRGEVAPVLPGASARDEIGDLARSFGGLLGRVRDYNLYLQGLGGKLAHELRTPLAMVQSSLDNLDAEPGRPGPWLDRARLGVERMSRLVTALAAARRIEAAMAAAGRQRFDLAAQLEDMVAAWQEIHAGRAFALERPTGPCLADGAPDLLAQALDKLVENAVDFAPPGGRIAVGLAREADSWQVSVANPGSRLPTGPAARLFDSLVSRREGAASAHLGLGLYIVRLVAEGHGGRAWARNLPGDEGVEFVLELAAVPEGERRET
jgi:signal transduction histidine kinase